MNNKEEKKYSVIKLSEAVKSYPTFTRNMKGWINYDRDNLLPDAKYGFGYLEAVKDIIVDGRYERYKK